MTTLDPRSIVRSLCDGAAPRALVTGAIGTGKSRFVTETVDLARAEGITIAEVACVEFENDMPFLPLTLLLTQLGVRIGDRSALDAALGADAPPPNMLALGTAVADELHERSSDRPILVVIDDAHWADADSLKTILFAARRLDIASVGFVLTARPGLNERLDRAGLDVTRLERWTDDEIIAHLTAHGFAPTAARSAVGVTGGNPLAVSLLVEAVDDDQRAGFTPLPPVVPVPDFVADRVSDAFAHVGVDGRRALAVAAALADAERHVLDDALRRCGLDPNDLVDIAASGAVELGSRVRWASPIERSAALGLLGHDDIVEIHRHVADAAAAAGDDDLALRHRSAAGIGLDDELADQLERVGQRAIDRGAPLTAAESFRQAALASTDPAERSRRLSRAANEAFAAGNSDQAVPYARAAIEEGEGADRATATALLGEALLWNEGWASADRALCEGARLAASDLPVHAAAMLIHATIQAVVALDAPAARDRAARARAAAERSGDELIQLPVPVVAATAENLGGGAAETDPVLAGAGDLALAALGHQHPIGAAIAELVGFAAITREEAEQGIELLRAANDAGRAAGSVGMTAITSYLLTDALWRSGQWTHAQVEIGQALDLARASGFEALADRGEGFRAWTLAATGRRAECVELAERSLRSTEPLQLRFLSQWAHAAIGLAALTDGDAESAAAAYDRIAMMWIQGDVHEPNLLWWQGDHIEALVLADRRGDAEVALRRLVADAELTGRPHAHAMAARGRALLAAGEPERLHHLDEAVDRLRAGTAPFDLARCLLARGECRGRAGDTAGGATDLAEAHERFDRLGAHPWSDRASASRNETGSTPPGLADVLTEAELRVALTIAAGAQNREAAAQLYVSTKTVEYHLSNIYRKLEIRSRVDLARVVSDVA